uniref:Uncharacterized protein n=1 Tax=Bracon brevicornis TaxID=1563983 RepID=A0A6V7MBY0_9HYME
MLTRRILNDLVKFQRSISRKFSAKVSPKNLEHLKSRSLISIKGPESSDFLQGLITNDIRHLSEGIPNIYTLFLNTRGRVLYDTIIYKSLEENTFLIEVDAAATNDLQKHLKMYKLRRKVDISSLEDKMKVWASFETDFDVENLEKSKFEGRIFPCGSLTNTSTKILDDVMIFKDPRIPNYSLRILSQENVSREEIAKKLDFDDLKVQNDMNYRAFRYRLGIGEGVDDLSPGKSFPLEINCDYMHGVSFHKGCYIGQELTARTHHTGVVRKRLMPLIFDNLPSKTFNYDENVIDEKGKSVGKFKGNEGKLALGLMRISEALSAKELKIQGEMLKVVKPCWWPVDSPKEKMSIN